MTDNQRKRWAGLVVLYNPMEEVIDNIKTYADSLDKLYILDNTDRPLQWVAKASKDIPSAQYIAFKENVGLAAAFNRGLHLAAQYDYLLIMDQDSSFPEGMLEKYKKIVGKWQNQSVAVFGINYDGVKKTGWEYQKKVISSGSVLPIRIAGKIGGFDENLFIDEVIMEP